LINLGVFLLDCLCIKLPIYLKLVAWGLWSLRCVRLKMKHIVNECMQYGRGRYRIEIEDSFDTVLGPESEYNAKMIFKINNLYNIIKKIKYTISISIFYSTVLLFILWKNDHRSRVKINNIFIFLRFLNYIKHYKSAVIFKIVCYNCLIILLKTIPTFYWKYIDKLYGCHMVI